MVEVIHVHNGNHEIDLFISFIANEVSLNIKIQSMEYFPRWTIPLNTFDLVPLVFTSRLRCTIYEGYLCALFHEYFLNKQDP